MSTEGGRKAVDVAAVIDAAEVNSRNAEPMVTSRYLEPDIYQSDHVPAVRPQIPAAPGH